MARHGHAKSRNGRGAGFYFRNMTERLLFAVRGSMRTLPPGRRRVNIRAKQKRQHARKPDKFFATGEACSPSTSLALFARQLGVAWKNWGNEVPETVGEHFFNQREACRTCRFTSCHEVVRDGSD